MALNLPDMLPAQNRRAPLSSVTIDAEKRTVELVFTTGATVRRNRYVGWDTVVPFDETLLVSSSAIDMSRLNAGAPVLDSHMAYTTGSQVGVVERAWVDKDEGKALIRFPAAGIDERADRMFGLVSDRIIRNVSVGYSIDKVRVIEPEKKGQVEKLIVERWTPSEISFVTVPADIGAQVRASDATYPVEVVTNPNEIRRVRMRMAERQFGIAR